VQIALSLFLLERVLEESMVVGQEQVRVLVVSASPYVRYTVSGELGSEPDLFVVGTAQTSDEVDHKQALLRPDLVIVDLESPRDLLNLQHTLAVFQSPVLVLSSHAQQGAELAFAALEAGATDVVARPNGDTGEDVCVPGLLDRVRGLARIGACSSVRERTSLQPRLKTSARSFLPGDRLVAVCASSGGFGPLVRLLTALPADLRAALLVLSPLPACYLPWFLRRIDPATTFHLRQALDGMALQRGVAHFAPRDDPLIVGPRGVLVVDAGSNGGKVHSSADVTLSTLATRYGPAVLAVILSGIGRVGLQGALDVRASGGSVIVQDTTTCLAAETPAAIIETGAATAVLPPQHIVEEIKRQVSARA
jgi:two-component system chemotaxis response regulator CheB